VTDDRQAGTVGAGSPLLLAIAYPDGRLGGDWFRAVQRVRRAVRRGGLAAQVLLVPASALPARIDALVVPPELAPLAAERPDIEDRVISPADGLAASVQALFDRLAADGRLGRATAPGRSVAVHIGFQAVAGRARLED